MEQKKIGILTGMEDSFPIAFCDTINSRNIPGITAEMVSIDKVFQAENPGYAVILDRISHDVPFYRAMLKNAAITGTYIMNNPFWWSADEKFFNNALAVKLGIPVPKSALLPSHDMPPNTKEGSFRNLKYPIDWQAIFNYVGLPAYMKPYDGGGWRGVSKIESLEQFFEVYKESGTDVMMLQEEITFDFYFRCYYLAGDRVHIMYYEPRNPHHLRYTWDGPKASPELLELVRKYTIALNQGLGYDFNTVEWAVRDGVPYAIDFCNPAPDAERTSIGEENFAWIVENAADMAIEKAQNHQPGVVNLTWGTFMKNSIYGFPQNAETLPIFNSASAQQ
jgi:hypothetical protein